MHIYIYDSFLNQKKYSNILAQIESNITDFGLNGKIIRLGLLKNINDLLDYEIKRGAKTIVAVGNDQTVSLALKSVAQSGLPLGIIPVGKNNNIAKALGINDYEEACQILSARRVTKLDLGLANENYFITKATIKNQDTLIEISQNYTIEIARDGETSVLNLADSQSQDQARVKSSPLDGILELAIATNGKGFFSKPVNQSFFPLAKVIIKNKKYPLVIDGVVKITPPAEINVLKQKLSVIVGKDRNF